MGKLLDQYFHEWHTTVEKGLEKIPPEKRDDMLIINFEDWAACKWTMDNDITPASPGFDTKILDLCKEDMELAEVVAKHFDKFFTAFFGKEYEDFKAGKGE